MGSMVLACPYCFGILVTDENKVTRIAVSGSAGLPIRYAEVEFVIAHRCPPGYRQTPVEGEPWPRP